MTNEKKTYTPKQLEVINADTGYKMVIAGPGCGKTDILAERIARAYEKGNVQLSDMLCLTFTNRAARGKTSRGETSRGTSRGDRYLSHSSRHSQVPVPVTKKTKLLNL